MLLAKPAYTWYFSRCSNELCWRVLETCCRSVLWCQVSHYTFYPFRESSRLPSPKPIAKIFISCHWQIRKFSSKIIKCFWFRWRSSLDKKTDVWIALQMTAVYLYLLHFLIASPLKKENANKGKQCKCLKHCHYKKKILKLKPALSFGSVYAAADIFFVYGKFNNVHFGSHHYFSCLSKGLFLFFQSFRFLFVKFFLFQCFSCLFHEVEFCQWLVKLARHSHLIHATWIAVVIPLVGNTFLLLLWKSLIKIW